MEEKRDKEQSCCFGIGCSSFKRSYPASKHAKPVLFAYAVYADESEKVIDFELAQGESTNAWYRFCQKLSDRGLKDVKLVVHDANAAISEVVSLVWPHALDQQCIFHILKDFCKKLTGCKDKRKLLDGASALYRTQSEEEFYRLTQAFKNKWLKYQRHPALKYLFKMIPDSIRYFELPKKF